MTNTGGTPAGWYHAPGDPAGTHRYWDGGQWIGEPQPVPQPQTPPPAASPPADDMTEQYQPQDSSSSSAFDPPREGQSVAGPPGGSGTGGAPPTYAAPGVPADAAPAGGPGANAEWGTRAIALLIDWAIGVAISVAAGLLTVIGFAIADVLGILFAIVWAGAALAYAIWNFCIRQGETGQTIGKEKQGIKLIKDDTRQPVGVGMAFVRYLIFLVLGSVCGVYTVLDYLWPLWDEDQKRITDKIVTMSVVDV